MLWTHNHTTTLANVESYVRQRFIYLQEQIETLQAPNYMLKGLEVTHHLVGDCDDISTLYAAILTCLGFKSRFVAIKSTRNNSGYDHVFVETENPDINSWVAFDMTVPAGTILEYYGKVEINI